MGTQHIGSGARDISFYYFPAGFRDAIRERELGKELEGFLITLGSWRLAGDQEQGSKQGRRGGAALTGVPNHKR